jgi:hypothetical protein
MMKKKQWEQGIRREEIIECSWVWWFYLLPLACWLIGFSKIEQGLSDERDAMDSVSDCRFSNNGCDYSKIR